MRPSREGTGSHDRIVLGAHRHPHRGRARPCGMAGPGVARRRPSQVEDAQRSARTQYYRHGGPCRYQQADPAGRRHDGGGKRRGRGSESRSRGGRTSAFVPAPASRITRGGAVGPPASQDVVLAGLRARQRRRLGIAAATAARSSMPGCRGSRRSGRNRQIRLADPVASAKTPGPIGHSGWNVSRAFDTPRGSDLCPPALRADVSTPTCKRGQGLHRERDRNSCATGRPRPPGSASRPAGPVLTLGSREERYGSDDDVPRDRDDVPPLRQRGHRGTRCTVGCVVGAPARTSSTSAPLGALRRDLRPCRFRAGALALKPCRRPLHGAGHWRSRRPPPLSH